MYVNSLIYSPKSYCLQFLTEMSYLYLQNIWWITVKLEYFGEYIKLLVNWKSPIAFHMTSFISVYYYIERQLSERNGAKGDSAE